MSRTRLICLASAALALLPPHLCARGAAPPAAILAQAQGAAPPAGPGPNKPAEEKDAKQRLEELRRAREARIKEIHRKVDAVSTLIKDVNQALKLRTSGNAVFDRKRALENRLRDLITLFALTERAIAEADRLTREARELRHLAQKGPADPRRLQLANFLEARQREYIIFGTR